MKISVLAALMMIWGAIPILTAAQPGGQGVGYGIGVSQIIIHNSEALQLSDDQVAQLVNLQLKHRNEMRDNRRKSQGIRGNRGQRINRNNQARITSDWRNERHAEMLAILTTDQRKALIELQVEFANNQHAFRAIRYREMITLADIDAKKHDAVYNILQHHNDEILELRLNHIATEQPTGQEQFLERQESRQKMIQSLREVLTDDEYNALESYLDTRNRYVSTTYYGRRSMNRNR